MSDHPTPVCVYAVIVHFGDTAPTRSALETLRSQSHPLQLILIVDNDPAPNDWSSVGSDVRVLRSGRNLGYAGGINHAVNETAHEDPDAYWVINNDLTAKPNALERMLKALESCPSADIVGCVVTSNGRVWFGGGTFSTRTGRAKHDGFGRDLSDDHSGGTKSTDWINGCNMLLPTRSLKARGPFDEHLFLYKEELEWQTRYPRAKAVLLDEPLIDHLVGQSTGGAGGRLGLVFMARNGMILALRQPHILKLWWCGNWAFEFLVVPLLRGRPLEIRDAIRGMRSRGYTGEQVIQRL